jgi:hypothetical protein
VLLVVGAALWVVNRLVTGPHVSSRAGRADGE